MGFLKKVFRAPKKIFKAAKKVVKSPLFPVIAGIAGPAALGAYGAGAGAGGIFSAGGALGSMGARAALSNAIAQAAQGDGIDAKQIALQGIVSQLGAMGSGKRDLMMAGQNLPPGVGTDTSSMLGQAKNLGIRAAGAVGDYIAPQEFKSMTTGDLVTNLKNIGSNVGSVAAATAINPATAEIMIDLNQQSIDDYNNSLLSSGMKDKGERRTAIFDYFIKNGYEEDTVNTMLDKYGYASGGITTLKRGLVDQAGSYAGFDIGKAEGTAFARSIDDVTKLGRDEDEDEENEITLVQDKDGKLKIGKSKPSAKSLTSSLQVAADAVETAFGRPLDMKPVEFKRFARGGEVEIEEQVDDLGIMDLMKDQGIQYGEQASYGYDDAMGETFEMFLDYKKKGTIPMEMEFDEFLELLQGRNEQGIKGTQVASGYKSDIEEMYEQYVFEMEEQGLEPMDFASFLRQARSGMAKGGMMKGPDWFTQRVEDLMYQGLSYEEASEQAYNEGHGGGYQDGGKVKRRKKGEPADEVIETEEEIFLDKMPRPKRKGIMEAAGGGSVGSRYSFLINKQKQGILSPDEEQELLMLEMTYADESQGKADGGIMNKNLLNTGMDKDMRGGGFIPEGTKEKADDVPARLSKNEFVMTADAVRAAGGGSINEGAKRMYETMHKLEAKV